MTGIHPLNFTHPHVHVPAWEQVMVVVAVVVVVLVVLVLVLLVVQEPPQEMEGLPVRSQEYPDTHTHIHTQGKGE